MKKYLLIAGMNYYPRHGTGDWMGTYYTREEAEEQVSCTKHDTLFLRGPRKGQVKSSYNTYVIDEEEYDWYEIVDLESWL